MAPLVPLEEALVAVWADLSPVTAGAYLRALKPAVRALRDKPHASDPLRATIPSREFGPYVIDDLLGAGGNGKAFAARHRDSGQAVTLKFNAGSEGLVRDWFGGQMPPMFLDVHDWGVVDEPAVFPITFVVRERADETWSDYLARRSGRQRDLAEALTVFTLACMGVAELHSHRVYAFSSHAANIFRVGGIWKLGDLGRCLIATSPDEPLYARFYGDDSAQRSGRLGSLDSGPWFSSGRVGFMPRDPGRERRLRLDDCAMLGGLLVDLLGLERWSLFHRAVRSHPICFDSIALTGAARTDQKLSRILNRAWLGDGGGALAVAAGQDWTAGYDDALELLADVMEVVGGAR